MDDDVFNKCSHLNKFSRLKELCRLKGETEPTYKPLKQTILKSLGCKELIRPVLNIEGRYSPETKNQIILSWHVIDHSIGMRITSSNIMPFIDAFLIYGASVVRNARNPREQLRESTFVLVREVEPGDRFPMKLLLNDVKKNILYGFKVRIRFKDGRFSMFSNIEELKI